VPGGTLEFSPIPTVSKIAVVYQDIYDYYYTVICENDKNTLHIGNQIHDDTTTTEYYDQFRYGRNE
jgi:hypothetical protein